MGTLQHQRHHHQRYLLFLFRNLKYLSPALLAVVFVLLLHSMLYVSNLERKKNGLQQQQLRIVEEPAPPGHAWMRVSQCNCTKLVPTSSVNGESDNFTIVVANTTCDPSTFVRGRHQKVVAFTYYDLQEYGKVNKNKEGREYEKGIRENIDLIKQYYPGFVLRLYYQIVDETSSTFRDICSMACEEPMFDICDAEKNPRLKNMTSLYPLIWRYLPALDLQVDLFLSRDLDSRVSAREAAAVAEFLRSDKVVHGMRDHPAHTSVIMGGMWGAKVARVRKELHESFKKMFKDPLAYAPRDKGGYDQLCLNRFLWPWAKKSAMTHDSYLCHRFLNSQPFPTKREEGVGNFVGSVVSHNSTIDISDEALEQKRGGPVCPEKCRPKEHQDWIFC